MCFSSLPAGRMVLTLLCLVDASSDALNLAPTALLGLAHLASTAFRSCEIFINYCFPLFFFSFSKRPDRHEKYQIIYINDLYYV